MFQEMVAVTPHALIKRINRKLAPEGESLKVTRGERWRGELGDYYTVDANLNMVTAKHIELGAYAAELGLLKEGEKLQ